MQIGDGKRAHRWRSAAMRAMRPPCETTVTATAAAAELTHSHPVLCCLWSFCSLSASAWVEPPRRTKRPVAVRVARAVVSPLCQQLQPLPLPRPRSRNSPPLRRCLRPPLSFSHLQCSRHRSLVRPHSRQRRNLRPLTALMQQARRMPVPLPLRPLSSRQPAAIRPVPPLPVVLIVQQLQPECLICQQFRRSTM